MLPYLHGNWFYGGLAGRKCPFVEFWICSCGASISKLFLVPRLWRIGSAFHRRQSVLRHECAISMRACFQKIGLYEAASFDECAIQRWRWFWRGDFLEELESLFVVELDRSSGCLFLFHVSPEQCIDPSVMEFYG